MTTDPHAATAALASDAGACPGDDTLIAMVEHALPQARVEQIADHVDRCERCRATIGHLAAVEPGATAVVGRYRLEEQLGMGGMGLVWAARDPMLERRVAIKLMRPEAGEHGSARLLREARALAQLQHPNVVAVFDVGEHAGEVFLATELVDGEPLDRWQKDRAPAEIVDVYVQAARGLAAAHAMGLVHRDVKPSNVFVGRDGRARVGDFGLAHAPALATGGHGRLTRDGAIVGTPAYMAPEQRAGQALDGRADQFALCVALAEALTGGRPSAGATQFGHAPPHVAAALARGLARDPDARFPDMTALADALAGTPPRAARLPWVIGIGLLVVGAGAMVAATQLVHREAAPPDAAIAVVIASAPAPAPAPAPSVVDAGVTLDAAPAPAPSPAPPAPPARTAAPSGDWKHWVEAINFVNGHDGRCARAFAAFDAAHGVLPPAIGAHDDRLARARCRMLAGDCAGGTAALRALLGTDGLAPAAIDGEVGRETAANCPTSTGSWRERLVRLQGHAPRAAFGTAAELVALVADAEAIARDGGAAMTRSDQIDLSNALGFVEQGLARLAGHCADVRRARALALYDPPIVTPELQACLAPGSSAP